MNRVSVSKPNVFKRTWEYLRANTLEVAICFTVGVLVVLSVALPLANREREEYLKAPAKSCASKYTGNKQTETYVTYQCVSYDSKMNCLVTMPFTNVQVFQEVNNQCNWNEWR